MLPRLNNGDTGSALNRSLRSVNGSEDRYYLFYESFYGRSPDARGLRPMRTTPPPPPLPKWSGQHLFLQCPSPFGVLRGLFCQPCHLVCFRAQRSPASAYLKVHPETLWPWNSRPLRGGFSERSVQMLPVSVPFQDVVLTAESTRQSVAYRAPKYGGTGSVLNRSLRSVKRI